MTDKLSIEVAPREKLGTAESGRIRKDNMIPAVIYSGKGENEFISLPKKEIDKLYLMGNLFTTILEINLKGRKQNVLARELDIHPVYGTPRHIDFTRVEKDKPLKAKILLKFEGRERSPGIKRGGYLNIIYRRLDLIYDSEKIPNTISVNIDGMKIEDKIKMSDLELPDGVKLSSKKDLIIATMTGRGGKKSNDDSAEQQEAQPTTEAAKK